MTTTDALKQHVDCSLRGALRLQCRCHMAAPTPGDRHRPVSPLRPHPSGGGTRLVALGPPTPNPALTPPPPPTPAQTRLRCAVGLGPGGGLQRRWGEC